MELYKPSYTKIFPNNFSRTVFLCPLWDKNNQQNTFICCEGCKYVKKPVRAISHSSITNSVKCKSKSVLDARNNYFFKTML